METDPRLLEKFKAELEGFTAPYDDSTWGKINHQLKHSGQAAGKRFALYSKVILIALTLGGTIIIAKNMDLKIIKWNRQVEKETVAPVPPKPPVVKADPVAPPAVDSIVAPPPVAQDPVQPEQPEVIVAQPPSPPEPNIKQDDGAEKKDSGVVTASPKKKERRSRSKKDSSLAPTIIESPSMEEEMPDDLLIKEEPAQPETTVANDTKPEPDTVKKKGLFKRKKN